MTGQSNELPVLVTDGVRSSGPGGFTREFPGCRGNHTRQGNLDAFNDLLAGASGPGNGWVLRWLNSELPRSALGYETTIQRLKRVVPEIDVTILDLQLSPTAHLADCAGKGNGLSPSAHGLTYWVMMTRACRSPAMSIRSVHSARAVRTNLSAIAFIRGACGALATTSIPQAVKTASNAAVNLESRSLIR